MAARANGTIAVDIREIRSHHITGIGRFVKLFLKNVQPQDRARFYLLADSSSDVSSLDSGFNILYGNAISTLVFDQVSITCMLKRNHIKLFYSPYFKMPLLGRAKSVITIHDLHFLEPMLRRGWARWKPFVSYLKTVSRKADTIITVSEFSKRQIISRLGVNAKKIKIVYNGIDPAFHPVRKTADTVIGTGCEIHAPYILYVGNLEPHKNVAGLITAYNLLGAHYRQAYKLVIVAHQDRNVKALRALVERLSLAGEVIFIDFVCDSDLAMLYSCAEVFAFPSFYEGFGLPPVEAMACGAAVVSSGTTSLREVLQDAAVYVDPYSVEDIASGLSRMLESAALRQEYRARGLAQAQKYSGEVFAGCLLKELEECM
jgi:glycosyltransferase involved in cell wall biosynthesis